MASFADFKKSQSQVKDAVKTLRDKKSGFQDDRIWNITKDKAGNGSAVIRFLPQPDPSKSPIIQTFRHGFEKKGRWFIEECPVTIGESCPVCDHATELFAEGDEDEGRVFWRTKTFIANVLVVEDKENPENNGKVKIFKFGKQIYDIVMEAAAPEDEDEDAIDAFSFDSGHNFRLKVKQKGGYNNYESSKFEMKGSAIGKGDESVQEEVFMALTDLSEFTDISKYKPEAELRKKLVDLIGGSSVGGNIEQDVNSNIGGSPEPTSSRSTSYEEEENDDGGSDDDVDFDALLSDDDD